MVIPDTRHEPEEVDFDGCTYRLMGGPRRYYLSQSRTNAGRRGAKGLHVAIWEAASGEAVTRGMCIHHRDGDTFNNDPGNLELLSRSEHARLVRVSQKMRDHLEEIRPLAAEWHRSTQGRRWHSQNASGPMRRREAVCIISLPTVCDRLRL